MSTDFLAAKREWLERYGTPIQSARNWRNIAFTLAGMTLLLAGGLVYEADRVHVVPYVVQVDKLGQTVKLAQAVRMGSYSQPVVRHILSRFIYLVMTQNPDEQIQKQFIDESFKYIASSSQDALDAFYQKYNPYAQVNTKGEQVVQIESVDPIGKLTKTGGAYIVDFKTITYGKKGTMVNMKTWQATLNFAQVPPSDNPHTLEGNPFGIYITHFAISRRLG